MTHDQRTLSALIALYDMIGEHGLFDDNAELIGVHENLIAAVQDVGLNGSFENAIVEIADQLDVADVGEIDFSEIGEDFFCTTDQVYTGTIDEDYFA